MGFVIRNIMKTTLDILIIVLQTVEFKQQVVVMGSVMKLKEKIPIIVPLIVMQ
jgi:hypothetical protein